MRRLLCVLMCVLVCVACGQGTGPRDPVRPPDRIHAAGHWASTVDGTAIAIDVALSPACDPTCSQPVTAHADGTVGFLSQIAHFDGRQRHDTLWLTIVPPFSAGVPQNAAILGVVSHDTLMQGTWTANGRTVPLTLARH